MSDNIENVELSNVVENTEISNAISENSTPEIIQTPVVEEKTLTQSQVNKIVTREKRDAEKKAQALYEAKLAALNTTKLNETEGSPDIRQQIREEAWRMTQEQRALEISSQFESKIRQAIQEDPDFADDYDALGIENYPALVMMVNGLDNTADVLKELARHPSKFSSVLNLANMGSQTMAKRELTKLSTSIRQNKLAKEEKKAPAPLGQIKSSSATISGDDKPSVTAFMRKFKA